MCDARPAVAYLLAAALFLQTCPVWATGTVAPPFVLGAASESATAATGEPPGLAAAPGPGEAGGDWRARRNAKLPWIGGMLGLGAVGLAIGFWGERAGPRVEIRQAEPKLSPVRRRPSHWLLLLAIGLTLLLGLALAFDQARALPDWIGGGDHLMLDQLAAASHHALVALAILAGLGLAMRRLRGGRPDGRSGSDPTIEPASLGEQLRHAVVLSSAFPGIGPAADHSGP